MALKSRWKPVEFQRWNNVKFLLQISTLKIQRWFNVESAHWVEPTCPLGVEIWLKWGWYLVDFWLNWGWYFQRLRHGWIKVDMWLIFGWFKVEIFNGWNMVETWLKWGWWMVDFWLIWSWDINVEKWLKFGWNLVDFWLIFGWEVDFWLNFGWFLVEKLIFGWWLFQNQRFLNQISTLMMVEDGWGSTLNQRWFNVERLICAHWGPHTYSFKPMSGIPSSSPSAPGWREACILTQPQAWSLELIKLQESP